MQSLNGISSPLSQRLGLHVQNVIQQISVRLKYFLDNVNTIYQTHGINFPIKQNYTNLMRMLTPFELLSRFQMIQNNQLLSNALVQKMKQTVEAEIPNQPQNYQEFVNYNENENQSVLGHEYQEYQNQNHQKQVKQEHQQMLHSQALYMLRGMREQKEKQLKQKQKIMKKDKKQKDKQEQKQKTKQGISVSDRIKRDSTKNYRQKGIIGKKKQNLSVIKPNTNHYMRQSIYIQGGRNYLTEQLEKQLSQWATGQLLKGSQLMVQDILYQAKYLGRSIPNLVVSYGWLQRFMRKYSNLRRLFRKSKGFQRQKSLKQAPPIRIASNQKSNNISMMNQQKKQILKQKQICQRFIYDEDQQFEQESDHQRYENEQFNSNDKDQKKYLQSELEEQFGPYQMNMGLSGTRKTK